MSQFVGEPLPLRVAARQEMEEYQLGADLKLQPKWDVPEEIAINVAVAGRMFDGTGRGKGVTTLDAYIEEASSVIEAGAVGIHTDFGLIQDSRGRQLSEIPPLEAHRTVIEPLRERFGRSFVTNCNVLHGETFEECLSPARSGLAEVAPCAAGHPDAFMLPAVEALEDAGVKPEIVIHSSGEIELAKRKLIDTGILKKPYYYIILFGLPFNSGRTLVSGNWLRNTADLGRHLFMMVDQIKAIDEDSVITVCAAGRATLYITTLATMMGLHVRVGLEDSYWRYPNSDEQLEDNLQMFNAAKEIAALHGRRLATADEYRQMIGLSSGAPR